MEREDPAGSMTMISSGKKNSVLDLNTIPILLFFLNRYSLHGLTSGCLMVAGVFEIITYFKVKNLKFFD